MNKKRYPFMRFLPLILILFGTVTTLVVLAGNPSGVRAVLAFIFLLLVPGLAYVRLLPAEDGITLLTLSVALSLAIDTIAAVVMLYAGKFSLNTVFLTVAIVSLLGAILQVRTQPEEREEGQI